MLVAELAHVSLFEGLSQDQMALIYPLLELCDYSCDKVIFEQGDAAHYLYIVLKGMVLVRYRAYDGPMITVARSGPGDIFGWSSVLGRPTYSSDAVALEDSIIIRINGKGMQRICENHPDTGVILLERLANVVADHLRNTHDQILDILTQGVEYNGHHPGGPKHEQ